MSQAQKYCHKTRRSLVILKKIASFKKINLCDIVLLSQVHLFSSVIDDFLNLTNTPGSRDQSGCLGHEPVDVGEALVPQVDGDVHDVGHEAEGGQRRV